MAAWHFLKRLTCTLGAHSPPATATLSRSLMRLSLPFLSNHHKLSYHHCPSHIPNINIHATASSSAAPPDKSLTPLPPYLSVLIHCPKHNADVLAEALLCFGASSVTMDQDDVCQSTDEICISSIFPEGEDINLSISHAVDSIGLKEIPGYEVKVNEEEEDWMKRAQESFHPIEVIEGLWVVPMWITPPIESRHGSHHCRLQPPCPHRPDPTPSPVTPLLVRSRRRWSPFISHPVARAPSLAEPPSREHPDPAEPPSCEHPDPG